MNTLAWYNPSTWRLFDRKTFDGFMPFSMFNASPVFNEYGKDAEKINAVFSNPAVLKVFTLQCDLFSMGRPYVYSSTERERVNDPALDRMAQPNYFQSGTQFLWDYMFWKMIGNAYLYMSSDLVDRANAPMYWLDHSKIEWPNELNKYKDRLVLSEETLKEIDDIEITYRYEDGSSFKIPLSKIITITDLTNGVGNWWKGHSRIDALYKVISNSEASLDAKNINVRFSGKFMVNGQQPIGDVTKLPLGDKEKETMEQRINSDKPVTAVKSLIDIKRFVDDLRSMELDKAYLADFFLIGSMYNIPRDVLEAYVSSTYENQEKARGAHVAYTLDPAGKMLGNALSKKWGYKNKSVILSWDHLPFVQAMEKERATIQNMKINTLNNMLRAGIPIEQCNTFLDTNFTDLKTVDNGKTK